MIAMLLMLLFSFPAVAGGTGFGTHTLGGEDIWMGWTYYTSGNSSYALKGDSEGHKYGRYQFDIAYDLPEFMQYCIDKYPDQYRDFEQYLNISNTSTTRSGGLKENQPFLDQKDALSAQWNTYVSKYGDSETGNFKDLQDSYAIEKIFNPAYSYVQASSGLPEFILDDPRIKGIIFQIATEQKEYGNTEGELAILAQAADALKTELEKDNLEEADIEKLIEQIYSAKSNDSSWSMQAMIAAQNETETAAISNAGQTMSASGQGSVDYVADWINKYRDTLSKKFITSGAWNKKNREWASTIRGAGDFFKIYGLVSGEGPNFTAGVSTGIMMNIGVNAETKTIPNNGSSMNIVYFAQGQPSEWAGVPFGGKTIAYSGCSVTCLAMVISYLRSKESPSQWIYPNYIVAAIQAKYGNYNYFYVEAGQSWDIFPAVAGIYKVNCNSIDSSSIMNSLSAGMPVIMSCKPGEFTSHGHFIVLTGLTSDGYITVNDPSHPEKSYIKYPLSTIIREGKGWWSFSK